ncbi:metal-sulfur cluster assembly factor [Gleimia hominis]|uniref:Metal-sulfur cluster assembly factor n=1 Tax=Gleimia hominis TaxID=595468 RepID=A0ABU3ICG3_9ACTO|nr:metal-sulfur cluster assembly factor [Gleimia hominis]MDT3768074.1 metal-sulfur cluster assembly factor [Gleimia hominis]
MDNPMANPEPVEQRFAPVEPERLDGWDKSSEGTLSADDVEEALKDVIDPELGINIVDLGLVYGIAVDKDNFVDIDMTLTSAACPLTDVIENQAQMMLADVASGTAINWVWMPPWGPDRITDDGREQLRALGFNV